MIRMKITQLHVTHSLLVLSNCGSRDSGVTSRGFNVLRCRGGRPNGKVLLVEGGEESGKHLGSMVSLIKRISVLEPFLLFIGAC